MDVLEWAESVGVTFEWRDDWSCGSHVEEYPDAYDQEPEECLYCVALSPDGDPLGSLGCIDDPSNDDAREVEAELAHEALESIGRRDWRDVPLFPAVEAIAS